MLDLRVRLTKDFIQFPPEQQSTALQLGIESCLRASTIAQLLGDKACIAFYKVAAGNGYLRAGRIVEAEEAYREALRIRRQLAVDEPEIYEPDVAKTLNNLGAVLCNRRHFEEAKEIYCETLEIQRRLATDQPAVEAYHAYQQARYKAQQTDAPEDKAVEQQAQQTLQQARQAWRNTMEVTLKKL